MKVNGEIVRLEKEYTVGEFLDANGYERNRIAVERNREILTKSAYDTTVLDDSDRLEIVQFVGGG